MGKNKHKGTAADPTTTRSLPSRSLPSAAAAAAGLIAPAAIAAVAYHMMQSQPLATTSTHYTSVPSTPVPIVTWDASDHLADFPRVALAAWETHKQPVLLRGVPLASWGGRSLWAHPSEHLEAVIEAGKQTARPKVSRESFFQYFFSPKRDEWRDRWKLEPPSTTFEWDMDSPPAVLRDLLGGTANKSGSQYGYWILQCAEVPDIAAALDSASPSSTSLFASPYVQAGTISPITEQPMTDMSQLFWMTSPGVANNMHFDVDWNYLVHAYGPKKVVLAPPSDAQRMQLYPRAHPSLRSSPVDLRIEWPSLLAERPMLANVSFLEAELQPMDVLLIPPFWLHFVHVGHGPATSFSFFSTCTECEFLKKRLPQAKAPAEAVLRIHAILHAYYGDGDAADALAGWGLPMQYAPPLEEEADGGAALADDDDDDAESLDLGPTAKKRQAPSTRGGKGGGGGARRFITEDLLRRSYRATPEMAQQFCPHDDPTRRPPKPERCPEPGLFLQSVGAGDQQMLRGLVANQWTWAERVRRIVTERAVASIILLAEVEDLAYSAWGPTRACVMMERCIASTFTA